jgi:hypothetical protein
MINSVSGNGPTDALGFFKSDTLNPSATTPNNNPFPNGVGAETTQGTGQNSEIWINANPSGAFLGGTAQMGSFTTGSLGGEVTMILHELAHTLAAIPEDSGSQTQSVDNTNTILKYCEKAIHAAVNSIAK